MDTLFKIARAGKSKTNAVRNLTTVLNAKNAMMPVPIDAVQITIQKKKPLPRTLKVWWPVLKMSDWVQVMLQSCPQILLCGYSLQDTGWQQILKSFWDHYQATNPGHEVFMQDKPRGLCVPYYLHGDEGRYLRNKPIMIEAFQMAISHRGPAFTNESGFRGTVYCTVLKHF